MGNISIKGIIIAVVVTTIMDIVSSLVGVYLFSDGFDEVSISNLANNSSFLIFGMILGALSTIIGGYISAYFGKLAPYKNVAIYAVLGVLIGFAFVGGGPLWYYNMGMLLIIPASLFGGYLFAAKNA